MDVHDVGDYQRPLAAGMTFVVEPGIYVRPQALDELPDTPENRKFKDAVRGAVEKYKFTGIRIEDSFLLTDDRPEAPVRHRAAHDRGGRAVHEDRRATGDDLAAPLGAGD